MSRASTVSEKVWAQAIHAVTVQKMSLRRAAQLYGVHHMSLHRRVRGRYMTNQPSRSEDDFRLTAAEEEEVVMVLREQFHHEGNVSPDDVRFVVRTIASRDGQRDIPADFPLHRWMSNFRRVHALIGDASPREIMTPPTPPRDPAPVVSPAVTARPKLVDNTGNGFGGGYDHINSMESAPVNATTKNGAPTTGFHSTSSFGIYTRNEKNEGNAMDSTSESESEHHRESQERTDKMAADTTAKACRQSNMVSAETWEKAMDAVEIHGMSLRNAAKAFGVHFAALHRRVKKRALKKEQSPPLENYIPFEDEAGIVRVIHARADLGILMGFGELADLLDRTAAKYTMMTPDLSRAIVRRFQSRVEHSIRHLIKDWPLPHFETIYRYPTSTGNGEDEKMSSQPMPPHLPALFPRNRPLGHQSEPKTTGMNHHQQQMQMLMQMHAPTTYYRSDGKHSPKEMDQSPRASMLHL